MGREAGRSWPVVYILRCADDTLYTGWTSDLEKRLAAHSAGRGGRYTRVRRPVLLVYWEPVCDRSAALKRELQIKRLPRAKKEVLVSEHAAKALVVDDVVHGDQGLPG